MIDLVILKDPLRGESRFFRDRETRSEFTDVIGAWSWPERLNGHMIVFALARQLDVRRRENRVILCMQEWEIPDVPALVRLIGPATKFFKVQTWITDTYNYPAMDAFGITIDAEIMSKPREARPIPDERYWPVEVPFARDIKKRYFRYAHIIRDQLPKKPDEPARLHFGKCETARISARQIQIEKSTTIEDFPVVAALGFGVSYLRIHRGGTDEA